MKEYGLSSIVAIVGTSVSAWLGGWDMGLQALVIFMIVDYLTGVLCGIRKKKLSSDIMFWGGIRKAVTLIVIIMAVLLDGLVGNDQPIFRTLAIYFYVGREGLSIVENLSILGVPIPKPIKAALEQITKDDEKDS